MKTPHTKQNTLQYSVEWKENGKWHRSECEWDTPGDAREHAKLIGCEKYQIIVKRTVERIYDVV